jgi:hypothetical protein
MRTRIRYALKICSDCSEWKRAGLPGTDDLADLVDPFTLPPPPEDK